MAKYGARGQRLRKLFTAAAVVILMYTGLGFLLAPAVLKDFAARELTSFLGRPVTIKGVGFNPYTMSLAAHGLRIEDLDGSLILSLDTVSITFAPVSSLLHRTWVFKEVVLLEPFASVVRNAQGALNLSDMLLLDWPKSLGLRFDRLLLVNGQITFRDDAVPGGFSTTVSRLAVTMKNFSTVPGHDNVYSISAFSEAGERFSCDGSFRVHPLSSQGRIAAEDVVISKYSPYFGGRVNFTVAGGTVSGRASYDVNLASDALAVRLFDGSLLGRTLQVDERGSTARLFGCTLLSVGGVAVDLVNQSIKAESLVVSGASASVRGRADKTLNIQHLVQPARILSPRLEASPVEASPARWKVSVGEIRLKDFAVDVARVFGRETVGWKELLLAGVTFQVSPPAAAVSEISLLDGAVTFTDPSVEPPVKMSVSLLNVHVGAFSTASPGPVPVAVHARIEGLAPLQIAGTTSPLGSHGETSVRGLIQNLDLVPLSPYAAKYLGYELAAGDFSLEVECLIQRRTLNLENTISIDRLTLGRKVESPEATNLPVPLAIALLKDAGGKITLHVPMAVALDDPRIDLPKVIIDGVFHPFTMTAAFPFAALGAQSGGGGEELGFQEFIPGSADLIPREAAKLNVVLRGLKQWPEILLDIEGSVDSQDDTGDLGLLAADRAAAVREYLLRTGVLEPGRIFLIENRLEEIPRKGSRALLYLKDKYLGPG